MKLSSLLAILRSNANFEAMAKVIDQQSGWLPEILDGLQADKARLKYGCLKILRRLSEKQPTVLYPYFDRIAGLLGSDNTLLKWGAIIIVGNLAAVDSKNKIDGLLEEYLKPISGRVMITAANTIGGAGKVAKAKPYLADKIVRALLQVETAKYQTPECRNVALGHVLKSADLFFEHVSDPQAVLDFTNRQLRNRRNAVRLRARAFLKKHAWGDRGYVPSAMALADGTRRGRKIRNPKSEVLAATPGNLGLEDEIPSGFSTERAAPKDEKAWS